MAKINWIAEVGQNHNGQLFHACALARGCIEAGADWVKFQLYDCNKIFKGDESFYMDSVNAELTESQALLLARFIKNTGGFPLFSVFDVERFYWVVNIWNQLYPEANFTPIKIASRMINDPDFLLSLIQYGRTKKPLKCFLSLGRKPVYSMDYYKAELFEPFFLECKSEYPCTYTDEDWKVYEEHWKNGITHGFSDHSIGTEAIEKAISLGATIIEKHITINQKMLGPDHVLSITPKELAELIKKYR